MVTRKRGVTKKRISNSSFFLLLIFFLLLVGSLFIYFKPRFTGFVTNVIVGGVITSYDFSGGVFESTKFDAEENAVVLDNSTTGNYVSQIFDSGQEVTWNNFVYTIDLPPNSSIVFSIRSCDDANCEGEGFNTFTETLNISGRYFQYKVEMTGENSPKLYEVNISYSVPQPPQPSLYVNIESPQATTYTTDSILIKISSNAPNIWFSVDGAGNEIYTNETTRTFAEGQHTLFVWVNDSSGNQNTSSVTFSVSLITCGDNTCEGNEDCSSCPSDCGECEEEEVEETPPAEETSEVQVPITTQIVEETPTCTPNWQCSEWSECVNNVQSRTCDDVNVCGIEEGKPALSQSCTPPESCSDGIKNQDEKGIDCGGVCEKRCPFFTIVGSTIKGLPATGKQFFKEKVFVNKTRTFLILGIVVFLAGGFIAFKILKKRGFSIKIEKVNENPPKEKFFGSSENNTQYFH